MKPKDLIIIICTLLLFLPFFISEDVLNYYKSVNTSYPFLSSFIKFAVLSTYGEVIGLRIKTGSYLKPGFGIVSRAVVWGFLGIGIKAAFIIFGEGAPSLLTAMGITFPVEDPSDILDQNFFKTWSWLQFLTAATISITMNTFFAPVFMTIHKITDTHIIENQGSLFGLFRRGRISSIITRIDWKVQWDFVFMRTIPFFWYPAHTITFLLPQEYRILFAAILGVVLGILLSIASLKSRKT